MVEWYDLNARHEAMFLWLGVILLFAMAKSGGARSSILSLLESFIKPVILGPVLGLFIVVAGVGYRRRYVWEGRRPLGGLAGGFSCGLELYIWNGNSFELREFPSKRGRVQESGSRGDTCYGLGSVN